MKKLVCLVSAVLIASAAFSAQAADSEKKGNAESAVRQELKNHFKFYGLIRNYFAFDTRESTAGTGEL